MHKWGLITPTYVPENSLLVMGGWCQAVLLHSSIDHASLMSSDVHNYAWREAFTVEDYYPVYPVHAKTKAHADEVLERYEQSKKHPTADRPRTVCTCRYVVVHESICVKAPKSPGSMAADSTEQTKRGRTALEAVASLHRPRSPEPPPREPLVPPGAVPGPEGRVDDDAARAADDAWARFSPSLWSLTNEQAGQCNPLDSAVDMDVVTTIWNTLQERMSLLIFLAEENGFGGNKPNVLAAECSRLANNLDARLYARTVLIHATFVATDKAVAHGKP
jgi:hypothetical protein